MGKGKSGFRLAPKMAVFEFEEGHEYHGLEVRCRTSVPVGMVFEMQRARTGGGETEASLRRLGDELIVDWNLEDENGHPVPPTGEGLLAMPAEFAMTVLSKWLDLVTEPGAPLGRRSSSGSTSAAPPIPMEAL